MALSVPLANPLLEADPAVEREVEAVGDDDTSAEADGVPASLVGPAVCVGDDAPETDVLPTPDADALEEALELAASEA